MGIEDLPDISYKSDFEPVEYAKVETKEGRHYDGFALGLWDKCLVMSTYVIERDKKIVRRFRPLDIALIILNKENIVKYESEPLPFPLHD